MEYLAEVDSGVDVVAVSRGVDRGTTWLPGIGRSSLRSIGVLNDDWGHWKGCSIVIGVAAISLEALHLLGRFVGDAWRHVGKSLAREDAITS